MTQLRLCRLSRCCSPRFCYSKGATSRRAGRRCESFWRRICGSVATGGANRQATSLCRLQSFNRRRPPCWDDAGGGFDDNTRDVVRAAARCYRPLRQSFSANFLAESLGAPSGGGGVVVHVLLRRLHGAWCIWGCSEVSAYVHVRIEV